MSVPEESLRQGFASSSTSSSKVTSEESNEAEQTRSEKSEGTAPGSSRGEFGGTEARSDGATTDYQPTGTSPIHMPHENDSRGMLSVYFEI